MTPNDAARLVGQALGRENEPRAEARIAADLARAKPCPKCGTPMDYEPAHVEHYGDSPWDRFAGSKRFPASLACPECGHWEDATPIENDNPND